LYYYKKKALIEGWRQLWGQGDFPFYTVQLANLHPYNPKPAGGEGYAQIREAQRRLLNLKKTGLAVIYDIGNPTNIHPGNKQDVGARLAYWALAKEYGQNELIYSGPLYEKTETLDNEIHVHFSSVGSGLMVGKKEGLKPTQKVESELKGFAIAGSDKIWHWAKAKISADGKSVILTTDKVKEPVAVRYAYRWNPIHSNLYNEEGLPASPFRTDNWEK
jgi:sialate O-acetylesterase